MNAMGYYLSKHCTYQLSFTECEISNGLGRMELIPVDPTKV